MNKLRYTVEFFATIRRNEKDLCKFHYGVISKYIKWGKDERRCQKEKKGMYLCIFFLKIETKKKIKADV